MRSVKTVPCRTQEWDFCYNPYSVVNCLFVQICIVRTVQPSLKRNSFLLRFYRTHVTIIIACT